MSTQTVQEGVVVAVAYKLTVNDEEIEHVDPDQPLEYLHGANNIVPGLENALTGKKEGDAFTVTVEPEEGYGDYEENLVEQIPRQSFDSVEGLEVGMLVALEDDEGTMFDAVIRDIDDQAVTLDFNPPLAGETLTYNVTVVNLRQPTDQEREQGYPDSLLGDVDHDH